MKICFFGSEEFSLPILKAASDAGHSISCIVTKPDAKKGRGYERTSTVISEYGSEHGITVLKPQNLKTEEFAAELKAHCSDIFVVCSYGRILPKIVLECPPKGCINVHPSMLPKYRGATPIESALRNGESETGVTIFYMNETCDGGDIILQEAFSIAPDDTRETLREKLAPFSAQVLIKALKLIENGTAERIPQPKTGISQTSLISEKDLIIDWSKTSDEIINHSRSIWPSPGARTFFRGKTLILSPMKKIDIESTLAPGTVAASIKNRGICVKTADGAVLLDNVKPEGKKLMTSWQFACGCSPKTGEKIG